jgi:protein-S-isoprenylcysteine O-methyltransferase Ste14
MTLRPGIVGGCELLAREASAVSCAASASQATVAGTTAAPAQPASPAVRHTDWLDQVECLLLVASYAWLVVRMVQHVVTEGGLVNLLLLPSEGLVLVFIIIRRRPLAVSRSAVDWLLAMVVTSAPMLAHPGVSRPAFVPAQVVAILMFMGLVLQLHAKLTLGRSLGCVPANRGVKSSGPYCFVRHPMYAGYLISHVAFLLINPTWWNLCVYAFSESMQIPRLLAEERLLRQDPVYQEYCRRVPYRLIPGVF